MSIQFYNEDIDFPKINKKKVSRWVDFVVNDQGYGCDDISIVFCSDDYLLEINKQYLQHDYFTDIITFDYTEEKSVSGDLFISLDRVKENAKEFQVEFLNELLRVIIHGVLHLLGYKDKDPEEKRIMTSKEDFYLKKLD